ncbi:MAG: RecX family transcriptional regulator [Bacteroidetes bacterium]|nr:RecX family transcriptional regulator [Bacteroidota bacterium]
MNKKIITPGIALSKAQAYCAYQERSHDEVRKKLWEWEIDNEIAENIIVELINDGFINESRFAESYARGKFRIKKWGKQKIKAALRQKKVTEKCISEALSKINMSDYQEVINEIAVKKLSEYKGDKLIINKTAAYLIQRGFESELIWDVLNGIRTD